MGCKGQRRREKNFRAAHGGDRRLPPPPTQEELDAVPAKLRRLMELRESPAPTSRRNGALKVEVKKRGRGVRERGEKQNEVQSAKNSQSELADKINETVSHVEQEDRDEIKEKKKTKRKRKTLDDLHIQKLTMTVDRLTKRERRKEFLKERKKKNRKQKIDDIHEFPGHEDIKFGEVVQAPPKLSLPKAFASRDASHERLRLKAVEAYRNRKGWVSRPGMQFPVEPHL